MKGVMRDGFWRAPRQLRLLLEDAKLTTTEFALVAYVALAGADRDTGLSVTYESLASVLHVSKKTIQRALRKLRGFGLVRYDLKQGQRSPFRLHLGRYFGHDDPGSMSEVVSEVTSDRPARVSGPHLAPPAAFDGAPTSDMTDSRLAPTKTEIERDPEEDSIREVFDAYLAPGGRLELEKWRGVLARQAGTLLRRGAEPRLVIAAAAELGREREFPGYLSQRVKALEKTGGPCRWAGLDRSRLTPAQLAECPCLRCAEWISHACGSASGGHEQPAPVPDAPVIGAALGTQKARPTRGRVEQVAPGIEVLRYGEQGP